MNSGFLNFIFYFIRGVHFTSKATATINLETLDFVLYPSILWYSTKNTITSKCSGLPNKFETLLHPFKHTKDRVSSGKWILFLFPLWKIALFTSDRSACQLAKLFIIPKSWNALLEVV